MALSRRRFSAFLSLRFAASIWRLYLSRSTLRIDFKSISRPRYARSYCSMSTIRNNEVKIHTTDFVMIGVAVSAKVVPACRLRAIAALNLLPALRNS